MIMSIKMRIREKFELSDGTTILACSGYDPKFEVSGKKVRLVSGGEVRQILTISGERTMLNQKAHLDLKAFETTDTVKLSSEEAQSGEWSLIGE